MLVGGIWFAIGLVVTIGTAGLARREGGGQYVVAYGAIIWGVIQFLRGVDRSKSGIDRPFRGKRH